MTHTLTRRPSKPAPRYLPERTKRGGQDRQRPHPFVQTHPISDPKGRFHCLITPHRSPNHDVFSWEEPPTRWMQKEHTSCHRVDNEQPRSPSGALQARATWGRPSRSALHRGEARAGTRLQTGEGGRVGAGRTAFAGAACRGGPHPELSVGTGSRQHGPRPRAASARLGATATIRALSGCLRTAAELSTCHRDPP